MHTFCDLLAVCHKYCLNSVALLLSQNLSITLFARVRTDDAVLNFRGTLGRSLLRLVTRDYDGGFLSTPAALELAVTGFQDIIVSPKVVVGALFTDKYVTVFVCFESLMMRILVASCVSVACRMSLWIEGVS